MDSFHLNFLEKDVMWLIFKCTLLQTGDEAEIFCWRFCPRISDWFY